MLDKLLDKLTYFIFGKPETKPPKLRLSKHKSRFTYSDKKRTFFLANVKPARV
jgi:hypothetical protein